MALQERQKEVLEGVTAVLKVTDYKTQVKSYFKYVLHIQAKIISLNTFEGNPTMPRSRL